MNMELSKDEKTLIIQIPMKFQKRGGRKLIFAPDGRQVEGKRDFLTITQIVDNSAGSIFHGISLS